MHLEFLVYGNPQKHEEFKNLLSTMKYQIEAGKRKGFTRPFVSELRLYDVRILKECAPMLLRDLSATMFVKSYPKGLNSAQHKGNLIYWAVKIMRKLLGLKVPDKLPGLPIVRWPGHKHIFFLGGIDDPEQVNPSTGIKKEVL